MNIHIPDNAAVYLPAVKVAERYGVSDMTLWRWLRDPAIPTSTAKRVSH